MSLAQTQSALARLYTDAALRERFFADPVSTAATLGLTTETAEQLARMSAAELTSFAHSLRAKRLNDLGKMLPLTRDALGQRFGELFSHYSAAPAPPGERKIQQDALSFANFLTRALELDGAPATFLLDLVRFEAACLAAAQPSPCLLARRLRHGVPELLEGTMDEPRPTLAVWLRLSERGRLRRFAFSFPRIS